MTEENRPQELEDKDRIEAQERAERMERNEGTLFDHVTSAIDIGAARAAENLNKYGLKNPHKQEPEEEFEYHRLMDSLNEKQRSLLRNIESAYSDRGFSRGPRNALLRYVAKNPIEVPRRHLWRIRRGLDEPLFGKAEPRKRRNKVEMWDVATTVWLCERCAEELREESEKKEGVEPSHHQSKFHQKMGIPLYLTDGKQFSYLFEWGEGFYIKRRDQGNIAGLTRFPGSEPHVCERCGVDDVELWREHFGEAE